MNDLIADFKKGATAMLFFLKNVNRITFEVVDEQKLKIHIGLRFHNRLCLMKIKTFSPNTITYEIKLKELSSNFFKVNFLNVTVIVNLQL